MKGRTAPNRRPHGKLLKRDRHSNRGEDDPKIVDLAIPPRLASGAAIAQSVERLICNQQVGSSILSGG